MQDQAVLDTLPQYRSHKIVRGAKILDVVTFKSQGVETTYLVLDCPAIEGGLQKSTTTIQVSSNWLYQFKPQPDQWFVVYEGGYTSVSPNDAFVNGYSLLEVTQ